MSKTRRMKKVNASGYDKYGASRVKPSVRNWHTSSKSAHEDISDNLELLRERSRDLYSGGGPLGRGAIDRVVINSVGPGLSLNCRLPASALGLSEQEAEELENIIEREFALWSESKDCDITRSMNFYELQNLAFKSVLLDGDVLVLMPLKRVKNFPYELRVQLIEGDRLADPLIRTPGLMIDNGVELDQDGQPVAYYIANRHPKSELPGQESLKYIRVPAFGALTGRRNVLHLCPCERINQHRGVPFLAPVIEILKQLGRYSDAELMAAVIGGIFAIFFEHTPMEDGNYITDDNAASDIGIESDSWQDALNSMKPDDMYGLISDLPAGVSAKSISPSRPNNAFDSFVMSLTRQIGSALGIPAEVLTLNFQSSYSASRGALLEAWKLFKYWRSWWEMNFCQPVYEEWLMHAVLSGRINLPGYLEDYTKRKLYSWADWTGPSQGQLNPVVEVQAAALRVENGFSTRQRETAELTGGDFELNHRQRIKEESLRQAAGFVD